MIESVGVFMSEVEGIGPSALPGLREKVSRIIEEASRQGASACTQRGLVVPVVISSIPSSRTSCPAAMRNVGFTVWSA